MMPKCTYVEEDLYIEDIQQTHFRYSPCFRYDFSEQAHNSNSLPLSATMSSTSYFGASMWKNIDFFHSGNAIETKAVMTWMDVFGPREATGSFQLQNYTNSTQYRIVIDGKFPHDQEYGKKGDHLNTTVPLPDDCEWTTHVLVNKLPHPFVNISFQFATNRDGISRINIKLPYHGAEQPHRLMNALIEAHKQHVRPVFEHVRLAEARLKDADWLANIDDDDHDNTMLKVNYPGLHVSPSYRVDGGI